MRESSPGAIILAGGASRRFGADKASALLQGRPLLGWVAAAAASVCAPVVIVRRPGQVLPALALDPPPIVAEDAHAGVGPLAGIIAGLRALESMTPRSLGESITPRSPGESTPPRSLGETPAPRSPGESLAPRSLGETPAPRFPGESTTSHDPGESSPYCLVCSCDAPLLAPALVVALHELARESGAAAILPVADGHPQPLLALYRRDAALPCFEAALAAGERSINRIIAALDPLRVEEPRLRRADPGLDSFRNCNTPDALAALEAHLAADARRA